MGFIGPTLSAQTTQTRAQKILALNIFSLIPFSLIKGWVKYRLYFIVHGSMDASYQMLSLFLGRAVARAPIVAFSVCHSVLLSVTISF